MGRISEVIRQCDKPFEWGKNDCCTLITAAVQANQGRDIMRGFRGYGTKQGAAKKLRDKGKGTLLATLTDILGDPIHVAQARPGDIVMQTDFNAGICQGRMTAMLDENGLYFIPTLTCKRAFRNG